MKALLEDMPVKIVLNDDSGIIGAARYALIQKAFRKTNRATGPDSERSRTAFRDDPNTIGA